MATDKKPAAAKPRLLDRILNGVERAGNALPDPALLFVFALLLTWGLSALLEGLEFLVPTRDPLTGVVTDKQEQIKNLLTGESLTSFLGNMVTTFTSFHPLGVVLVALLGVGVAEASGFINAGLKAMLSFTPRLLLTPMLILVAIVSHTAADAGYVLVIPLGGVIFYAAGRHPLAGIAAAFAGVSGGFSANFVISGIDPLLQGITQAGAQVLNPNVQVNPLCNWFFTAASSLLVIGLGWFITDKIVEPRLKGTPVDGDPEDMPKMEKITPEEKKGLTWGLVSMVVSIVALVLITLPEDSAMRAKPLIKITTSQVNAEGENVVIEARTVAEKEGLVYLTGRDGQPAQIGKGEIMALQTGDGQSWMPYSFAGSAVKSPDGGVESITGKFLLYTDKAAGAAAPPRILPLDQVVSQEPMVGELTDFSAGLMKSIVPLIMLLFLIPGIVHGYVSGTFKGHRDVIKGMSKSMSTMGYYMVMAFFAALFIAAFNESLIGKWLAVEGANALRAAGLPSSVTVVGIIFLCAAVNLLVGSASAKWALLAPIFVPMLMQLGISPELTQAAYRVGDSTTNIVTPLMPYFPLVVAFSQRYVKGTGIGTLISVMLPYSVVFLICWTVFLLAFWGLGIPLGVAAEYTYTPGG